MVSRRRKNPANHDVFKPIGALKAISKKQTEYFGCDDVLKSLGEKEIWGIFERVVKLFSALSRPKDDGSIYEMASSHKNPNGVGGLL